METTSPAPPAVAATTEGSPWPVAGLFVEALARRDFAALAACLHPEVRLRALVPPGRFDLVGTADVLDRFQRWFGGEDDFEVVDASIGQVGGRLYLRWRVRMWAAGAPDLVRVAEQHAFVHAGERIESIDLLCSGFQPESAVSRCAPAGREPS